MNKREFLEAFASAIVIATISPKDIFADTRPILYGDGVYNDTKSLQALLDGLEVLLTDGTVVKKKDNIIAFPNAIFKIDNTIILDCKNDKNSIVEGNGCTIIGNIKRNNPILEVKNLYADNVTINNFTLKYEKKRIYQKIIGIQK